MALTNIEAVNIMIGNKEGMAFYPLFTDDEITYFLSLNADNVLQTARMASTFAAAQIAGLNTREVYGDVEFWNEAAKRYIEVSKLLVSMIDKTAMKNAMPYAAGLTKSDVAKYKTNTDLILVNVVSGDLYPSIPITWGVPYGNPLTAW
jgi:hypothetical protein